MQIFGLSESPRQAAVWSMDCHVVKMLTETVQIISATLRFYGFNAPYKMTHNNHPCMVWARSSEGNYRWLWWHAYYLGREFEYRYGHEHSAAVALRKCRLEFPDGTFPRLARTPFCNATKRETVDPSMAGMIRLYRKFYLLDKRHLAVWTVREPPEWYKTKKRRLRYDLR